MQTGRQAASSSTASDSDASKPSETSSDQTTQHERARGDAVSAIHAHRNHSEQFTSEASQASATAEPPNRKPKADFLCSVAGCPRGVPGNGFTSKGNLHQHERSHKGVKPFPCSFPGCKRAYAHPRTRDDHEAVTHRGIRPYLCPVANCGRRFTARGNTIRHMQGAHSLTKEECRAMTIERDLTGQGEAASTSSAHHHQSPPPPPPPMHQQSQRAASTAGPAVLHALAATAASARASRSRSRSHTPSHSSGHTSASTYDTYKVAHSSSPKRRRNDLDAVALQPRSLSSSGLVSPAGPPQAPAAATAAAAARAAPAAADSSDSDFQVLGASGSGSDGSSDAVILTASSNKRPRTRRRQRAQEGVEEGGGVELMQRGLSGPPPLDLVTSVGLLTASSASASFATSLRAATAASSTADSVLPASQLIHSSSSGQQPVRAEPLLPPHVVISAGVPAAQHPPSGSAGSSALSDAASLLLTGRTPFSIARGLSRTSRGSSDSPSHAQWHPSAAAGLDDSDSAAHRLLLTETSPVLGDVLEGDPNAPQPQQQPQQQSQRQQQQRGGRTGLDHQPPMAARSSSLFSLGSLPAAAPPAAASAAAAASVVGELPHAVGRATSGSDSGPERSSSSAVHMLLPPPHQAGVASWSPRASSSAFSATLAPAEPPEMGRVGGVLATLAAAGAAPPPRVVPPPQRYLGSDTEGLAQTAYREASRTAGSFGMTPGLTPRSAALLQSDSESLRLPEDASTHRGAHRGGSA